MNRSFGKGERASLRTEASLNIGAARTLEKRSTVDPLLLIETEWAGLQSHRNFLWFPEQPTLYKVVACVIRCP